MTNNQKDEYLFLFLNNLDYFLEVKILALNINPGHSCFGAMARIFIKHQVNILVIAPKQVLGQ